MLPPKRDKTEFEQVKIGEFVHGYIHEIQYDMTHKFKGFEGKADSINPAIRFIFDLDGYAFKHYSRWMRFNYGDKSNLYGKYLLKLVENAEPDMEFDLDCLKGMRVKTIWNEKNDFQNIESIFPEGQKVAKNATPPEQTEEFHIPDDTTLEPF